MSAEMFSPGSTVNVDKAYEGSYGKEFPSGTIITDPLGTLTGEEGYDLRPEIRKNLEGQYAMLDELMEDGASFRDAMAHVGSVKKALSTTDYQLPVFPLEDLTRLTGRSTPVWDMLPKVSHDTKVVEQDSVLDVGGVEIGGETDVPPYFEDDYQGKHLEMTYYRVRGSVTGPMQLASAPLRNANAVEQQNKSQAMAHFSANLVLNGNPTTGTTDGSIDDERGYKGIRQLAIDNGETSPPQNGDGSTITVEDVRQNQRKATEQGGSTSSLIHVTDGKTLMDLKNDINEVNQVVISGGPNGTIEMGAESVMVDGVPVFESDFMPNQDYNSTSNPTGREFLTVDMRYHSVRDLSSLVMEPLAKTEDADSFFMKRYSVMLQAAGAWERTHLIQGLA